MITRTVLAEFFDNTRALRIQGKARFDVDEVCRWSYFFVDEDRAKLFRVADSLERGGYENVGLLDPSPNDDDHRKLFLRMDRVERHDVDTLYARVLEFYEVARRHEVAEFDGMDVGGVDGP